MILWLAYKGGDGFEYTLRDISDQPAPTIGSAMSIGGSASPHAVFEAPSERDATSIMTQWLKGQR